MIAQADGLLLLAGLYAIADAVGLLLPWLTLGLLVPGIAVARRRAVGMFGAGLALTLGAGTLAGGMIGGATFLRASSPGWGVPPEVMLAVFDAVTGAMRDSAVALVTLGLVVTLAGWLAGGSTAATHLRRTGNSLTQSARATLQRHGLNTGRFGG